MYRECAQRLHLKIEMHFIACNIACVFGDVIAVCIMWLHTHNLKSICFAGLVFLGYVRFINNARSTVLFLALNNKQLSTHFKLLTFCVWIDLLQATYCYVNNLFQVCLLT